MSAETICPTCGRPASSPYRIFNSSGEVEEGCVDAAHDGELQALSASARWHSRDVSVRIRKEAERIRGTRGAVTDA